MHLNEPGYCIYFGVFYLFISDLSHARYFLWKIANTLIFHFKFIKLHYRWVSRAAVFSWNLNDLVFSFFSWESAGRVTQETNYLKDYWTERTRIKVKTLSCHFSLTVPTIPFSHSKETNRPSLKGIGWDCPSELLQFNQRPWIIFVKFFFTGLMKVDYVISILLVCNKCL